MLQVAWHEKFCSKLWRCCTAWQQQYLPEKSVARRVISHASLHNLTTVTVTVIVRLSVHEPRFRVFSPKGADYELTQAVVLQRGRGVSGRLLSER